MEFTLLGNVAVAVALLYGVLWWDARRGNAARCTADLWELAVSAAVVGLFAGRIWAMVAAGVNPVTAPADIMIVRAGIATGPAAAAAIVTVAIGGRAAPLLNADGLAPAALAGLAGWHGGCVVRDACLGTASDVPWALAQAGSDVTRHPVEAYAALLFALAVVAVWVIRRRTPPGVAAGLAIAAAATTRLVTEPFRVSLGGGPTGWYVAGAVVGVVAVVASAAHDRRSRRRIGTAP